MNDKMKVSKLFDSVGNKTKELADNVINTVKENAPVVAKKAGEIGDNVHEFTNSTIDVIKEGSDKLNQQYQIAKMNADREKLKPIFKEDLVEEGFTYPNIVRVVEYDKQHMENVVCKGAIGFLDIVNDAKVLNIYKKNINDFSLQLYPNVVESIYYISPFAESYYVDLNEYFNFQKMQRVDELNHIAYALGAKYFKVTVMEEKKSFISKAGKAGVKGSGAGDKLKADASFNKSANELTALRIESEMNLGGNNKPSRPILKYFSKENDIISLVNMRVDTNNYLKSKTFQLKYNSSTIIKEKEAAQIDAVLKKFKIGGNMSISSEVEQENRMTFEYYIEFPEEV